MRIIKCNLGYNVLLSIYCAENTMLKIIILIIIDIVQQLVY